MLAPTLRIAMVAGEASGDLLGARLIEALRRRVPSARFCGIGGPHMVAAGFDSWFPQETLAVRGFVEVLRHLPSVLAVRRALAKRLRLERPQLFVGIDAPEFNLGLERRLKRAGVVTVHLVSPQVWAWRPGRVHTVGAAVSRVLVLFPFEEAIYEAAGVPVTYVGHPLADDVPEHVDRDALRVDLRLPARAPVVAVLPGSRQSEIAMMAAPFIETAKLVARRVPDVRFLVPLVTRETRGLFEEEVYRRDARELPLTLLFGHAQDALGACDVALAASGTVTLEAALTHRPMVIAYRVTPLSFAIASRLVRVRHIGLPNILCGEPVVPEFLQDDATPENLAQAVVNLLGDEPLRRAVERRFERLHGEMRRNAAERAADALLPLLGAARGEAPEPA
jgi:lipid-A-disaccharide synthase